MAAPGLFFRQYNAVKSGGIINIVSDIFIRIMSVEIGFQTDSSMVQEIPRTTYSLRFPAASGQNRLQDHRKKGRQSGLSRVWRAKMHKNTGEFWSVFNINKNMFKNKI